MIDSFPGYFALITMLLLVSWVLFRVRMLKKQGIEAMDFGKIDKTDFLIPPFAFFYFYLILAHAFDLPLGRGNVLVHSGLVPWVGIVFLIVGLTLMLLSLSAFGKSFRVGIDLEQPGKLVTTGIFARTRNPIYLAFICVFLGQFLVFSHWVMLAYLIAGIWLIHRQILREEEFLKAHYGKEYTDYAVRVRRYF